jgi:TolA-binding protein
MNHREENQILIDNYLQGKMSDKEKVAFEQRLIEDADLRAEFENQKKVIEAIQAGALKEKLEELHLKHQLKNKTHKRFYLYTAMAVAASFAVVLSFWFLHQPVVGSPYEQTIASVYFKDPGLPTLMSSPEHDQLFELAMIDYKQGDYRSSLDRLTELNADQPHNDTIQFYMGVNWYELGNFNRAGQVFDELRQSDSEYVVEKAQWFAALNYLQLENREQARELFELIAEDYSHLYHRDASNALLMMERYFDESE